MAKAPKTGRIHAIKGDSLLSLSSLVAAGQSSSFDVIYVDASHEARIPYFNMFAVTMGRSSTAVVIGMARLWCIGLEHAYAIRLRYPARE